MDSVLAEVPVHVCGKQTPKSRMRDNQRCSALVVLPDILTREGSHSLLVKQKGISQCELRRIGPGVGRRQCLQATHVGAEAGVVGYLLEFPVARDDVQGVPHVQHRGRVPER